MKLIVFDCDSTLSSIEGIDELARAKGDAVYQQVVNLTHAAMNGEIPLDQVFSKRLEIIQPDASTCDKVAQQYIDTIEPTAIDTIAKLRKMGYTPIILSGGFKRLIEPLAAVLGIDRIEAVPLLLDPAGNYVRFDSSYPTTYNGGKPEIIQQLKQELNPTEIIMVGDGVSDLETQPYVDKFIGFGRFTPREKVKNEAKHFIYSLDELPSILKPTNR